VKRIIKSKKGFTLIEMILVIGIIVILAAVMIFSVASYLSKANTVKAKVSSNQASFSNQNKTINDSFIDLGY